MQGSEPTSADKLPLRERLLLLWDRALEWMHIYLAFDVESLRRKVETVEESAPAASAGPSLRAGGTGSLPAAEWRAVDEAAGKAGAAPAPSKYVADVYEILRPIARTEVNTISLVRQRHWDIQAVLKTPVAESAPEAKSLSDRAKNWIALGAHPNIASCYEVRSSNFVPLVLSEYVDGESLQSWAQSSLQDPLPRHRFMMALEVAIDICRALEHAHERGVAHGALTPNKILVGSDNIAKLIGFGVPLSAAAKRDSGVMRFATSTSPRSATQVSLNLTRVAPWVAPERWSQPTEVTEAADVFALGVCLYELFGAKLPYENTASATPQTAPDLQLGADPASAQLASVLRSCVAWDSGQRPADMRGIIEALEDIHKALFPQQPLRRDDAEEADRLNTEAMVHFIGSRYTTAQETWEDAIYVDPQHLDSRFNSVIAGWRRGVITDDALIQALKDTVLADADPWDAQRLIGLVHFERGDTEAALSAFEQMLRIRPGDTEAAYLVQAVRDRARHRRDLTPERSLTGSVTGVSLNAQGNLALVGCDASSAMIWDLASGNFIQELKGHEDRVTAVLLSGDGRAALTGGNDGTIRLWEVATGICKRVIVGNAGPIVSLSVSADGCLVLWAAHRASEQFEGTTIQLWDIDRTKCLRVLRGLDAAVKSISLSSDGQYGVSGGDDKLVRVWDMETAQSIKVMEGHSHFVSAVCLSNDGSTILSASWDTTLRLWSRQTDRCLRTFTGDEAVVSTAALSADGMWAVSGGLSGTVRFWEVNTGRCLRTFMAHDGLVTSVAISANGDRLLSGGWDGKLHSWDTSPQLRNPLQLAKR